MEICSAPSRVLLRFAETAHRRMVRVVRSDWFDVPGMMYLVGGLGLSRRSVPARLRRRLDLPALRARSSRGREFDADAAAVGLTGRPSALVSALLKLEHQGDWAPRRDLREVEVLCIVRMDNSRLGRLSLHPPTDRGPRQAARGALTDAPLGFEKHLLLAGSISILAGVVAAIAAEDPVRARRCSAGRGWRPSPWPRRPTARGATGPAGCSRPRTCGSAGGRLPCRDRGAGAGSRRRNRGRAGRARMGLADGRGGAPDQPWRRARDAAGGLADREARREQPPPAHSLSRSSSARAAVHARGTRPPQVVSRRAEARRDDGADIPSDGSRCSSCSTTASSRRRSRTSSRTSPIRDAAVMEVCSAPSRVLLRFATETTRRLIQAVRTGFIFVPGMGFVTGSIALITALAPPRRS